MPPHPADFVKFVLQRAGFPRRSVRSASAVCHYRCTIDGRHPPAAPAHRVKEWNMSRPLPEDPIIRQLVLQARRAQLTRRGLLAGAGGVSVAALLAACTTNSAGAPTPAEDKSDSE